MNNRANGTTGHSPVCADQGRPRHQNVLTRPAFLTAAGYSRAEGFSRMEDLAVADLRLPRTPWGELVTLEGQAGGTGKSQGRRTTESWKGSTYLKQMRLGAEDVAQLG